jgi:hypothetical protein
MSEMQQPTLGAAPWQPDDWQVPDIFIDNVEGQPHINLSSIFKFDTPLGANCCKEELVLPPSLYPADPKQIDTTRDTIIHAAMTQADTCLVKGRSDHQRNNEIVYYLDCEKCKPAKPSDKENEHWHKEGIRMDRVVNKSKSHRPNGKSQPRRTQTKAPPKGCTCKFRFILRLNQKDPLRPYLHLKCTMKTQGCHNHHRIPFRDKHRSMSRYSDSEKYEAAQFSQIAPAAAAQRLTARITGGIAPTQCQLDYNRRREEAGGTPHNVTQGQALIDHLQKQVKAKHMRYMALYHEVTESSLLSITKYDLRARQEDDAAEKGPSGMSDDIDLAIESLNEDGTIAKEPLKLQSVTDKMALSEVLTTIQAELRVGQKILLGCAWCREDERRLFQMFPEVLMVDVTMATNNQRLPLFVSSSPGPSMKVFTPVRAFLPSQCRWVFMWMFGSVIPTLMGKQACSRVELVLSDGDNKTCDSFEAHKDRLCPKAKHGLCMCHLVAKQINECGSRLKGRDEAVVKDQLVTFKYWVFTWMRLGGIETEEEFNKSHELLKEWLGAFKVPDLNEAGNLERILHMNAEHLETILLNLLNHKPRWLILERKDLMHLQQKTTSPLEGVNQTVKYKSSKVVTPNMNLQTSLITQDQQVDTRMDSFFKDAQRDTEKYPKWTHSPSARDLTTHGQSLKQSITSQWGKYHMGNPVGSYDSGYFAVNLKRKNQFGLHCEECSNTYVDTCATCHNQSPIPRFARIRTVTFKRTTHLHDFWTVTCSCLHNCDGHPCRHIACLVHLDTLHFAPRHHRTYIAYYGLKGHEGVTQHYDKIRDDRAIYVTGNQVRHLPHMVLSSRSSRSPNWDEPHSICMQRTKNGLIPHGIVPGTDDLSQQTCSQGMLSQEVEAPDDDSSSDADESSVNDRSSRPKCTGHLYNDMNALIQVLSGHASGNPEAENSVWTGFLAFYQQQMTTINSRNASRSNLLAQQNSEYVDLYTASDRKRKCVRYKASGEPERPTKTRKHNT